MVQLTQEPALCTVPVESRLSGKLQHSGQLAEASRLKWADVLSSGVAAPGIRPHDMHKGRSVPALAPQSQRTGGAQSGCARSSLQPRGACVGAPASELVSHAPPRFTTGACNWPHLPPGCVPATCPLPMHLPLFPHRIHQPVARQ